MRMAGCRSLLLAGAGTETAAAAGVRVGVEVDVTGSAEQPAPVDIGCMDGVLGGFPVTVTVLEPVLLPVFVMFAVLVLVSALPVGVSSGWGAHRSVRAVEVRTSRNIASNRICGRRWV